MLLIEMKEPIKELKKIGAKKIFLQVPEGLKVSLEKIVLELEEKGFEVITSMDPCFGACDLKQSEAKNFLCDAVLHLGHTAFLEKTSIPVIYAPLKYELKQFESIIKKISSYLKEKNISEIGLVTTAQYLHYIPKIKNALKEKKIIVLTQKGKRVQEGQVLGCNYSAVPKKNSILYFGDGLFHPLGIHFSNQKEVILADPINNKISLLGKEKNDFLRKRILLIEKAKEANSFVIIVSTKEGQNRLSSAKQIVKLLKEKNKKAIIVSMDYISQDKLLGIEVGAYISTACPRLSIDDYASFKKTIINASEVKYILGESYDNYKLDLVY